MDFFRKRVGGAYVGLNFGQGGAGGSSITGAYGP